MKLTWYGHSCFRIDSGDVHLLIDPFLTGQGPFEDSGLSVADVSKGLTHVALTHGHDDHSGDAASICKQTGATLIAVYELANILQGQGVEKTEPGNPGGAVPLGPDGSVTFVPAHHSSSITVDGKALYAGNPCGLVVKLKGEPNLLHMGDTDLFSDMRLIGEIHGPKIGIVPIGDRFTMGAATAAYACRNFFDFETVIPCHFGTFPIIDQTPDAFVAAMEGHTVLTPKIGEAVEL